MSEDVQATVNVLSQSVSAWAESVTRLGTRLDAHEEAVHTILSRVARLEDARANGAKPTMQLAELQADLAAAQAECGRVEEERNRAWAAERLLRAEVEKLKKHLAEVTANLAYGATRARNKCEQALRDAAETKKLLEDARRESCQARIAEDIQRVEKEKAFERIQYLEKALANLSTAHEGLLADKEKAISDKEHAVCPYCHRCATCGTA